MRHDYGLLSQHSPRLAPAGAGWRGPVETLSTVPTIDWVLLDLASPPRGRNWQPLHAVVCRRLLPPLVGTAYIEVFLQGEGVTHTSSAYLATRLEWRPEIVQSLIVQGSDCVRRWGICERHGPKEYDFGAYMELFKKARKHGLKVQAVMSFHAGGGNVGDGSCDIPLPDWVIKVRQIGLCLLPKSPQGHCYVNANRELSLVCSHYHMCQDCPRPEQCTGHSAS
jgi:hypothetical protein